MLSVSPFTSQWPAATGIAILFIAWQKARIILARYLGLADAPTWRRGFDVALTMFFLILLALFSVEHFG